MDHVKINEVLKELDERPQLDQGMSNRTEGAIEDAAELIRSLRTECGNQETRIADLEEALMFYRDAWQAKAKGTSAEWIPAEELLDDHGEKAEAALKAAKVRLDPNE